MTNALTTTQLGQYIVEKCIPRYILEVETINKPYVLGISGLAPAVGKSTVASMIAKTLGTDKCMHLDLDNWIKLDRQTRISRKISGLDPSSWDMHALISCLRSLIISKKTIKGPVYDHSMGISNKSNRSLHPKRIICLAGTSCLWPEISSFANFIICINIDPDTSWRDMYIRRNVKYRNYSVAHASESYVISQNAYKKFVRPYASYADMHVFVNNDYSYSFA